MIFTTSNGKDMPLLDIASVVQNEDGSVEVSYRSSGAATTLTGQNAHDFKLAISSPYRQQQEEYQPGSILARKLASLREPQEAQQEEGSR